MDHFTHRFSNLFSVRNVLAALLAVILLGMLAASSLSLRLSAPTPGLTLSDAVVVENLLAGPPMPSEEKPPADEQEGWTAWSG